METNNKFEALRDADDKLDNQPSNPNDKGANETTTKEWVTEKVKGIEDKGPVDDVGELNKDKGENQSKENEKVVASEATSPKEQISCDDKRDQRGEKDSQRVQVPVKDKGNLNRDQTREGKEDSLKPVHNHGEHINIRDHYPLNSPKMMEVFESGISPKNQEMRRQEIEKDDNIRQILQMLAKNVTYPLNTWKDSEVG